MTTFREEIERDAAAEMERTPRQVPREHLDLASNDYLGLARHPKVIARARDALASYGAGSRASRLVSGDTDLHRELETRLAGLKNKESALLAPTGYAAALAGIGATVGRGDAVLVERRAHASLVDGARLCGARLLVFRDDDPDASRRAILRARRTGARRVLLVADGVTSMDATIFPLADFLPILDETDAWLFLDDAHATGVLDPRPDSPRVLVMGTLSKALGSQGGFLAGPRDWIRLVTTRGRATTYSTALAPPAVGAAIAALEVLASDETLRPRLRARADELRAAVRAGGFAPGGDPAVPIVPVRLGSVAAARGADAVLAAAGFHAPAIRPPTVPKGGSRLRLTASSAHPEGAYDRLGGTLLLVERPDHPA